MFHMTTEKCTFTLQDVEVLLGIPVDGEPVINQVHEDWINLYQMLLSVSHLLIKSHVVSVTISRI